MSELFKVRASRDSKQVQKRFRAQAEKAYEKFKITKELEETARLKRRMAESQKQVERYSDAMSMYIIDRGKEKEEVPRSSSTSYIFGGTRETITRGVKKFIKNMYTDKKFELKWHEFMCITFYLQVPLAYMIRHITLIRKWGALAVLSVNVLIGACIAMPVFMLLMFMGNYGRKSYIRFWECVPILKGVAYSIAIMSILQETSNILFAGICLSYVLDVLPAKGFPWKDCSFATEQTRCVSDKFQEPYNNSACCLRTDMDCYILDWSNSVFRYPAYAYLKVLMGEEEGESLAQRSWLKLTLIMTLLWTAALVMLLLGFKKIRGVLTIVNLAILLVIFIPFLIITIYLHDFSMFADLQSSFTNLLNFRFWIEIAAYSLHRELAGDVITFSAMSSPGISTTVDTFCIYTLKFLFLVLAAIWTSIGLTMLQSQYNIANPTCIDVNGFTVIFGLFPELLSQTVLAKPLLIIYFSLLLYWSYSVTVFVLNSFVGAVSEEFPSLVKLKAIFCFFICIGCCIADLFLIRVHHLEEMYQHWYLNEYAGAKIILVFFTLLGIYLYSLDRLSNDYHFTYGEKLNMFWIYGAQVAMLLVAALFIVRMFMDFTQTEKRVVLPFPMLIPIALGVLLTFLKYKSGKRATMINPDPSWGPPTFAERAARRRFDPKRQLRYKSSIKNCKHACLLGSAFLNNEIKYWRNKRFNQYGVELE